MYKIAFFLLCFCTFLQGQQTSVGASGDPSSVSGTVLSGQVRQSGSATAGVFAPVLDSEKRPITAGGFVKDGPVVFQDIAAKAGLTSWHHTMGTPEKNYIIETTGSGVALLDYDNDGWLDIYMVNGSTYDAITGKTTPPHAALFHNNHDGTFTNVAEQAGVTNDRWGFGVLLKNVNPDKHHWVAFQLVGGPKSPRDAVGAVVYLTADGMRQREDVLSGGSYESSNDQRVHFGIGDSTKVDDVEIHWPSGAVEHITPPSIDRFFEVEEGKGIVPSVYDKIAQSSGK